MYRLEILLKAFFLGFLFNVSMAIADTNLKKECKLFDGFQLCWGSKILTPDSKAPHTAEFVFEFKDHFMGKPTVTNAINVNGSGHGMTVYAWQLDEIGYRGRLNNMYIGQPVRGTITMSYIAIGQPK